MKKYIKSEKYDKLFIANNMMGPNSMWLLEEVCEKLDLKPGMRVLDMGCGKGLTSIFLAKEYCVIVFATDLWIPATENFKRFKQMGVADKVFPIHAEAHELPYAEGFFDVAISIDSYHYFGANELYLPGIFSKLVKKGGQFGIACPGLTRELNGKIPDSMKSVWKEEMDDLSTFRSVKWWYDLWEKTGLVDIIACGEIVDAKEIWYEWARIAREKLGFNDDEMLDADTEGYLTLVMMTAVKK